MISVGSKPSLWPKPLHPDSESVLQWLPQNFVAGPGEAVMYSNGR
jgi:hypothetical protein